MTPVETKQWIRDLFLNVLENPGATEATYAQYFSPDYVQHVDGKTLHFNDFVAHMKALKATMETILVTFDHILVDGDKVCTVHRVNGVKKNGVEIEAKVIALFQIKDKKIILCDELTRIVKGEKSDSDLGSRV